jgi:hypothetical protein
MELSDDEKLKIKLEETYRNEINKLPGKKSYFDHAESYSKLFQTVAIIIGVVLSLLQYRVNSSNERAEAARDYQKTFYQTQMNVYAEAVTSTSVISTAIPQSEDYKKGRDEFYKLFWGRMSMFEDKCVEQKMIQFRKLLIKFENNDYSPVVFQDICNEKDHRYDTVTQVTLKLASLELAHQCRTYTITRWLPPEEQNSYNLDIKK